MIHGNIEGIRSTLLAEMETLYTMKIPQDTFAPTELLSLLSRFCGAINREISVYISRKGEVLNVSIGGLDSVELPEIRLRRNADRLSCVRCIHTHPGGDPTLSDVDLQALMNMRFDAMAALGVLEGCATAMQAAFLGERIKGIPQPLIMAPVSAEHIPQAAWMEEIQRSEQRVLQGDEASFFKREERAILIGMESEDSLLELASLAKTAGAQVVGSMMQKRDKPDNATDIGSGKAERLALDVQAQDCDLVIFDDELTGAQIHNLETLLQVKVVDRTTLILDIFAQRAQSREGKLQVELAQLSYQLPRLMGEGISMSRLGGGIGTRGPGETKLEVERRRLRKRMVDLRHELEDLTQQRGLQRACRQKGDLPVVALVGYTNTGKSTLLN
ncbi:MAG: GTPase HflX, partial [Clostridia bacterium]